MNLQPTWKKGEAHMSLIIIFTNVTIVAQWFD